MPTCSAPPLLQVGIFGAEPRVDRFYAPSSKAASLTVARIERVENGNLQKLLVTQYDVRGTSGLGGIVGI